ncbi:MAG: hypothetical protein AB7U46_14685 [Paenirhodobacter sp.]|uniref:glycine zipper domain-containing protein n=1 Tax=Paenirhodobacter sp. TaxID=1965326 RepID=UPI003D0FBFBF
MATANPLKSNGKLPAEITEIEAQLAQLTADLGKLSKSVAGTGVQAAAEASDQAETLKAELAARARALGAEIATRSGAAGALARDRFLGAEGVVEDRVRAHPLAALGIAAGIGFAAALLAKR